MEGQAVKDFKVGQVVYQVFSHQLLDMSKEEPHYRKTGVQLVGRKWVTLASGFRVSINAVTPSVAEQQDFRSTPTIYATLEAAQDAVEKHKLVTRIKEPAFRIAREYRVLWANNSPARLRHVLATLEAAMSGDPLPLPPAEPLDAKVNP